MDTITHTVLGTCMGDAIAGKRIGKKAMLIGALAANLPDVDVFYSSFNDVPDNLLSHRGFTHSILFSIIMVPLLAYLFNRWMKKQDMNFMKWFWIFFACLFSHITLDSLTNYGTGWLEPFSHYRVSFNTIFVADPFFTISLLIATIILLILKAHSRHRKHCWQIAFAVCILYLVFTFANKAVINAAFKKSLEVEHIAYSDYFTTPTPLNNILWYGAAKTDGGYYMGYRSLLDKSDAMQIYFIAGNDSLLKGFNDDDRVKKLIRFSQDYYVITKNDSGGIDFHDVRFGQMGFDAQAPFVFKFHITKGPNSKALINEGRFEASTGDAFHALFKRIEGE